VLLNSALKTRFGFTPSKTSAQAFDAFIAARQQQGQAVVYPETAP
jgi:UDP-glucose 4-epimerase